MFAIFFAKWYTKSMEINDETDAQPLDETADNFVQRITDFNRAIFGDHVVILDTTDPNFKPTINFKKAS
jgi:hypothetical protein